MTRAVNSFPAASAAVALIAQCEPSVCVMVLAYASAPRHAPQVLRTRREKKAAGIHPNDHLARPSLLVRYLPSIVREVVKEGSPSSRHHTFMGRRGHGRTLKAERFTHAKGRWIWIKPIPPPEGFRIVYKVRKVAALVEN